MQTYIKRNEKIFIIDIIYYNPQEKIIKNFFDYTVFVEQVLQFKISSM